jgi:hypothetical protein
VKEMSLAGSQLPLELRSFLACVATILELPSVQLPEVSADDDPGSSWHVSRWLGGRGLGLVPIASPATFSWAGPWLARVTTAGARRRYVVMYGVPSGIVWDPEGSEAMIASIDAGFIIAAGDIALALPPLRSRPPRREPSKRSTSPPPPANRRKPSRRCRCSPGKASPATATSPAPAPSPPSCRAVP